MVLGDTYCSKGVTRHKGTCYPKQPKLGVKDYDEPSGLSQTVQPKSLCNIPARFSIEMQNPNWILREDLTEEERNYVLSELIIREIFK